MRYILCLLFLSNSMALFIMKEKDKKIKELEIKISTCRNWPKTKKGLQK